MGQRDETGCINEFVMRLAQLYVVAKCKCIPKVYKSTSHLDCFCIEEWVVEEFRESTKSFAKQLEECKKNDKLLQTGVPQVRINSTESLQIEPDSLCSTSRNLAGKQ